MLPPLARCPKPAVAGFERVLECRTHLLKPRSILPLHRDLLEPATPSASRAHLIQV